MKREGGQYVLFQLKKQVTVKSRDDRSDFASIFLVRNNAWKLEFVLRI